MSTAGDRFIARSHAGQAAGERLMRIHGLPSLQAAGLPSRQRAGSAPEDPVDLVSDDEPGAMIVLSQLACNACTCSTHNWCTTAVCSHT